MSRDAPQRHGQNEKGREATCITVVCAANHKKEYQIQLKEHNRADESVSQELSLTPRCWHQGPICQEQRVERRRKSKLPLPRRTRRQRRCTKQASTNTRRNVTFASTTPLSSPKKALRLLSTLFVSARLWKINPPPSYHPTMKSRKTTAAMYKCRWTQNFQGKTLPSF